MWGGAVGEVLRSNADGFEPGDPVLHNLGWRQLTLASGEQLQKLPPGAPLSRYLGVLGMPGLTAYVGLVDIASFKPQDVVFVSGAAGAVGSTAGQIARVLGASRVVGSAGSDEKVELLLGRLGFDAAFNYKRGRVADQLAQAAPDGIDVYFDNVGGEHLEAAIGAIREHGRVAACGAISAYNEAEAPPGPRNLGLVVGRRLTIRGYIVSDHWDRLGEYVVTMSSWLDKGLVHAPETVVDDLRGAPEAFIGMLHGDNIGKIVVRVT